MKGAMIRIKYIYLGVRGDISAKILTDLLFLRLSKILVLIGDQEIKINMTRQLTWSDSDSEIKFR